MEHLLAVAAVGFGASCFQLAASQQGDARRPTGRPPGVPDTGELEPVTGAAEQLAVDPPPASTATGGASSLGILVLGLVAIALQRVGTDQTTAWFGAMWLHGGHPAAQAGLLSACAVAAEFLAMQFSAGWVARVDLVGLMLACTLVSALRWWLLPGCTSFACAAALQGLHALSFGLFYPASLLWLKNQRPDAFFAMRYLMEAGSRAAGSGYYYLAAATLIPALGFAAVFHGCALLALLGGLLWLALLLTHRSGQRDRRAAP